MAVVAVVNFEPSPGKCERARIKGLLSTHQRFRKPSRSSSDAPPQADLLLPSWAQIVRRDPMVIGNVRFFPCQQ